jgi:hypothetical protein
MSLVRIALPTAVCAAAILWFSPSAGAAPPAAEVSAPAPPAPQGKPGEFSTVGTTAPVLTTAERLKLVLLEREWVARSVRPGAAAKRDAIVPPGFLRPSLPFETRVPATGPRVRTKPIQGAREIVEREKAEAR